MAAIGSLEHNPSMLSQILALVPLNRVLENVGHGHGIFGDPLAVFDAFMKSPGHRSNLLSSAVNQTAIGCVRSGDHLWITQNFWG